MIRDGGEAAAQNIGFAIGVDTIRPLLDVLRGAGGKVRSRGLPRCDHRRSDAGDTEAFRARIASGVLVTSVTPGSPAELAGLRPGDIIDKIGDNEVSSAEELGSAVRKHKPGDKVEVEWHRGDRRESATVTLAETTTGS